MDDKQPTELTSNPPDLNPSTENSGEGLSVPEEPIPKRSSSVVETTEPCDNVTITFDDTTDIVIKVNHEIRMPRSPSPGKPMIDVESSTALCIPPNESDSINVEEIFNLGPDQMIKSNFIISKPNELGQQQLVHNTLARLGPATLEGKFNEKHPLAGTVYDGTISNTSHLEISYPIKNNKAMQLEKIPSKGQDFSTTSLDINDGTITEDASLFTHCPVEYGDPKAKTSSVVPNMTLLESLIVSANMMRSYLLVQEDSSGLDICGQFVSSVDEIIQQNKLNPKPLNLCNSEILMKLLDEAMSQFNNKDIADSSAQLDVKILQD